MDLKKKRTRRCKKQRNTVVLGIAEQVNIKQCFKSARFCMSCIYMCDNGRMRERERKERKEGKHSSSVHFTPIHFVSLIASSFTRLSIPFVLAVAAVPSRIFDLISTILLSRFGGINFIGSENEMHFTSGRMFTCVRHWLLG